MTQDNNDLTPGMMFAEDCSHLAVDAIREKRFLIVTHPERWGEVAVFFMGERARSKPGNHAI